MSTYYDILRVPENADEKEIKAAYRQAALAYHPDHIPKGVSKRMRDDATQAWLEIQEAFTVLSDQAKREEYDTLLEEMRHSEEAEKQFEPVTPPPAPPNPKPTPAPTPQQTTPRPAPQPPPSPPTKFRSGWLWFCFQTGRHWREVCLIVAVVLFFANGFRDSETWTTMSVGIIFASIMAGFFIVVASGPTWKDKGRYIVNALCLITLVVTGIVAGSINSLPPKAAVGVSRTPPDETPTPAKNTIPSTSATRVADMLKEYGFEAMPPNCKNISLNELDSCLAKVKADLENKHLKLGQETGEKDRILALIQGESVPTTLAGSYLGTGHNVNANLQAQFVLFIEEHQGVIQGCFGVKPPLYGSGPLQGSIKGDDLQFDVTSPLYSLHFKGHRNSAKGWSGSYTAIPLGGKEQYGYYEVEKTDSKRYFKNFDPGTSCPTDKDMNH